MAPTYPNPYAPTLVPGGVTLDAATRVSLDATRSTTHGAAAWTLEDGGAGASIVLVGGIVRATVPAGLSVEYRGAAFYTAPRARVPLTADPWAVDVRVRLAGLGAGADAQTCLTVALERDDGVPGVRNRVYGVRCYLVAGTGLIALELQSSNVLGTSGTLISAPTGWARLRYRTEGFAVLSGVGVGTAQPTTWQLEAPVLPNALPATMPQNGLNFITVAVEQLMGAASDVTVDIGGAIETTLAETTP